jgi:gas vesicle protein
MNTSQRFLSGIILGVAAGVAIALFAQSRKGREILSDVADAAGEAGESLKTKFGDFEKQAKDLLKKGKAFIDDLESKAKDAAGSVFD